MTPVSIRRVVPNIVSARVSRSRRFYTDVVGLKVVHETDDMVFLASPTNPTAQVQLHPDGADRTALFITVEVDDVDAVHDAAVRSGLEIVEALHDVVEHGVRRFQMLDPDGVLVNVMTHLPPPPAEERAPRA